ncbi:LysE family translocator [Portibacter lacus]|uniref:Lysine transporter LysE n=1 Tax=Portibacter lacus TaxID=1099794 RepID=A0AA37WCV8_9BACT|nr:LysE family transporter [Portibacter lacus]GLR17021.1 hypothetical protein GCM10007940_16360 [Portibacter lacus]
MNIILQGLLLGLSLSILLGPVIFLFIDSTMENGFKAGLSVAFGVWCSDFLYILCAIFGFSLLVNVLKTPLFQMSVGIIGGLILVGIGIHTFIKTTALQRTTEKLLIRSPWKLWLKGFMVNLFNPFCALIWFGSISTMMAQEISRLDLTYFVSAVLGMLIITDIFKILLADKLVNFISSGKQLILKKASGLIIAFLGILLVIRVLV